MPRFDEPCYTIDSSTVAVDAVDNAGLPGEPLPTLIDPDQRAVVDPLAEPLVRVAHRRIRLLANYWHAGWRHAVPDTWLRVTVADRLAHVADALPSRWGLAVFDAWRPLALQVELYDIATADPTIEPGLFAPPSSDPTMPPPHLSGGAVDVTLTFDGMPLALGTGFDDTTPLAAVAALEADSGDSAHPAAARLRRALFWSMADAGFVVYPGEWWHFEHGTTRWAAITGGAARYAATAPQN